MPGPDALDSAVEGMLAGDEAAFRTVYREVQPPLLRYLTVLVGRGDADDVASETWTQAFRDLSHFTGDADGFRGWITTIGRHRALDHLRRSRRWSTDERTVEELVDLLDDADVEGDTLGRVRSQAALALVAALPPDQAEAIMLRTVLGFDAATAGRILDKSPGAVRAASFRGLRRLAKKIDVDS